MAEAPRVPQTPVPSQPPQVERDSSGINLIPQVAEKEIKTGVYKRKANLAALGILGAVAIVIVGILVFQGALALQANSIKNQTAEAEAEIIKNQSVEIKARATKEKLDRIEELLRNAIPSSTFVTEVGKAAATGEPIKITNLTIDENGEAFVDGTATNSELFRQWVANLTSEQGKEYFDKINVVSLTGNPTDGYKFSFKMSFLSKGVFQVNAN